MPYYPTNYQPNYQPTYQPYPGQMQPQSYQQSQLSQPLFQSNNGINWVQGEAGAKAYPVAANNSVLLMDSEGQYFYIKSADQVGMPMMKKFTYSEVVDEPTMRIESHDSQPAQQMNIDNLATKDDIKNLEQKINEIHEMNMTKQNQQNNQQNNQSNNQSNRNNGGQRNG